MDLGLAGKRAAVMAGSQGLGLACATSLAMEGARVAICARDAKRLEEVGRALAEESGAEVVTVPADVSNGPQVQHFVEEAARQFGGLDVLVTNKGGPPEMRFMGISDEVWAKNIDLILMSYVRAVRSAIPHFERAGAGSVVTIESTSVRQPIPQLPLSNSLRSAVVALSKTLALEYGHQNIRFNVVLPGSMDTDRIRDLNHFVARERGISDDEAMSARVREIPMRRLGNTGELGDLVAYLASPRSAYMTGAVLLCDGGSVRSVY